jgi:hypothetical protein
MLDFMCDSHIVPEFCLLCWSFRHFYFFPFLLIKVLFLLVVLYFYHFIIKFVDMSELNTLN